jgi:hypothetical protein
MLWKTACRLRHKIFFGLLLHDRLSTRNMLTRKNMFLEDYNCALCRDATEETNIHLFWDCQFAWTCWNLIIPNKHRGTSIYDEVLFTLSKIPKEIAMEVVIMGCWSIWMTKNDKIFRKAPSHYGSWKFYLKEGLEVSRIRAKQKKADLISTWIAQNL